MRPTVFLLRPTTARAKAWVEQNVHHEMTIDGGIPIDPRHIDAVLIGLEEAGLQEDIDYEVR